MPQDRNGATARPDVPPRVRTCEGMDARTARDHAAISDLADDILPP